MLLHHLIGNIIGASMTDDLKLSIVKPEPQNYVKDIMKDTLNGKKDKKNPSIKSKKTSKKVTSIEEEKYKYDDQIAYISGKGKIIDFYV